MMLSVAACGRLGYADGSFADASGMVMQTDGRVTPDGAVIDAPDAVGGRDGSLPTSDSGVPGQCTSESMTVVSNADDGQVGDVGFAPAGENSQGVHIGEWGGLGATWGFFRFAWPNSIPKTATFLGATLGFYGTGNDAWDGSMHALVVRLEDAADPPPVTGCSDQPGGCGGSAGRPIVSESVRWPATGGLVWPNGQVNRTPDLSVLLQSLLAAHGPAVAGQHLQFWLRGNNGNVMAEVITGDVGRGQTGARLDFTWCVP